MVNYRLIIQLFLVNICKYFQEQFSIDSISGTVRVNEPLEHDRVARWTATVQATDTAGTTEQTATGLYITC